MATEPINLIALTYHTVTLGGVILEYAEGEQYATTSDDIARNVIVCGFADFDQNPPPDVPFRIFGN